MHGRAEKGAEASRGRKGAAIVAAARAEFFEKGYRAASIEKIAGRAGVSKVTIYTHFETKERLFGAVIHAQCDDLQQRIGLPALEEDEAGEDPVRLLRRFGEVMADFLGQPHAVRMHTLLVEEEAGSPELMRIFLEAGPARMRRRLISLLAALEAGGAYDFEGREGAATIFVGMIKAGPEQRRLFGPAALPGGIAAHVERAVDLFLRAYARDDGPEGARL